LIFVLQTMTGLPVRSEHAILPLKQRFMMFKIVTVVGARPQFIKGAVLSREIKKHPHVEEVMLHTGQHCDPGMSDRFIEELEMPRPRYNLGIHHLPHGAMTGRMLEEIEKVLLAEQPDRVVVFGDTNSTLAGALAARKLHRKVAHVEAGLRSFNESMPEEINRILTDRMSDILFCPSVAAVKNLQNEGYANLGCKIVNCGDILHDAALYYGRKSHRYSDIIKKMNLEMDRFVLATIHRAENTDDVLKLKSIVSAFNQINREIQVVVPLHPRTRNVLDKNGIKPEFTEIEPVGYFDMVEFYKNCKLVMTDSGGMQKEAYFFKKPCLTLREETEWAELVAEGVNVLVGADVDRIVEGYGKLCAGNAVFREGLYGDGNAGELIVNELLRA
jgi:UDP-GlcNAc3NAcA epimerase